MQQAQVSSIVFPHNVHLFMGSSLYPIIQHASCIAQNLNSVVQREWAAKNPRATFKTPITVEDVLNSRMIAYPFRLLQCCLVTDGGGALILVAAERARDFPQKPVYLIGTGESVETPMVSQMADFTSSRAFRVAGAKAFAEAGITHNDVDHLMIYDAFAHLPIYGLEDLGFVPRGEAGAFIAGHNTAPGGKLPLNTNGGGLSYMHSGMYGMYALQGERAPDARHRPRADPRRQDLRLPRRRRHVRRLRHDHHVERAALSPGYMFPAARENTGKNSFGAQNCRSSS